MNIIIIEDDNLSQQTIIRNCKIFGTEINILGVFSTIESTVEFLKASPRTIDLIILDMILPGKSGIDFISELLIAPNIIITTVHEISAVKAFELNVVGYLKKPFVYRRFVQAIEKVINLIKLDDEMESSETIIFKNKGAITRILIKQIDYIESFADYVKIRSKNESFLHLIALKEIAKKLPADKFIQIHRQFIINIEKIVGIENHKVLLEGHEQTELPISRNQRKVFYEKLLEDDKIK